MLIKIDKSLVENMQGNPEYEEILITLEYLAIARREGKHAVLKILSLGVEKIGDVNNRENRQKIVNVIFPRVLVTK